MPLAKNSVSLLNQKKNLEGLVVLIDDTKKPLAKIQDRKLAELIQSSLNLDFKGRYRELLQIYPKETQLTKRILLVGTGKLAQLGPHQLRTLGSTATHHFKSLGVTKNVGFLIPSGIKKLPVDQMVSAFVEGNTLSQLNFNQFKTDRKEDEKWKYETLSLDFLASDPRELKAATQGLERGQAVAEGVNWARRLILLPGGDLYPDELVKAVQKMVAESPSRSKIRAEYWTVKELKKNRFGGVLGVGQGSVHPPRFIILEYFQGKRGENPIVLVGKGVTFDSGGLSLKPSPAMETMKYDMAGSASVLATFKIITDLKVKCNLVVLVPTAENMPDGGAIRVGDVLRMASGATVEVLNTDAEGRLILADALFWASTKYKPKAILDVATLTGACAMALGEAAAGIFSNNPKLLKAIQDSSERVHEYVWPLPDFDDFYVSLLRSEIADMKNVGGREAGATTASIFLRYFVKNNAPWLHFDIAGCGWYDSPRDFITSKGPSGIPIRLMADFVEQYSNKSFS